jgi:hypothetical protein
MTHSVFKMGAPIAETHKEMLAIIPNKTMKYLCKIPPISSAE